MYSGDNYTYCKMKVCQKRTMYIEHDKPNKQI